MPEAFYDHLASTLERIRAEGFYKTERVIAGPQRAAVRLDSGREVLNLCANNYLGLADDGRVLAAAGDALTRYGLGLASVRFICGTQTLHKQLEAALSRFLGTEDTILYSSCFDANGGLFETLLTEEDAVISDELNPASIIDGIRLCRARRLRFRNNDMADLETQLRTAAAAGARFKLIATDGVFSMDGTLADLKGICALADRHDALVMVDDSHGIGVLGARGRGTTELCGVAARVDIVTGTLGKALGGGSGGFVAGRKPVIDLLRQRSRPYLFSNTLPPAICAASLAVLRILEQDGADLLARLAENSRHFRAGMLEHGFTLRGGQHPIVPVMLGDAALAVRMADTLLEQGVYAIAFCFPVVPKGQGRIRTQMNAAHTRAQLDQAIAAFAHAGRALGILSR